MSLNIKTPKTVFLILLPYWVILFFSCSEEKEIPFSYEIILTKNPANLYNLNSIYDDYNSDLPFPASSLEIYFSSNRNSSGDYFDITGGVMSISYHEQDDILNIAISNGSPTYMSKLLPAIQTGSNELGPFSFTTENKKFVMVYANDQNGSFDFNYVYTKTYDWGHYNAPQTIYGPFPIHALSGDKDDFYFTQMNNEIYFSSNRVDSYHIYKTQRPPETDILSFFDSNDSLVIVQDSILSSNQDDKCPFIYMNLMVFTSDREGGYGGFDLYYSQRIDSTWKSPVNFGDKINSEYDEYRPVTFIFMEYDLMIFSSNRPGGKGGYDLYCVKIEDLIDQ